MSYNERVPIISSLLNRGLPSIRAWVLVCVYCSEGYIVRTTRIFLLSSRQPMSIMKTAKPVVLGFIIFALFVMFEVALRQNHDTVTGTG